MNFSFLLKRKSGKIYYKCSWEISSKMLLLKEVAAKISTAFGDGGNCSKTSLFRSAEL